MTSPASPDFASFVTIGFKSVPFLRFLPPVPLAVEAATLAICLPLFKTALVRSMPSMMRRRKQVGEGPQLEESERRGTGMGGGWLRRQRIEGGARRRGAQTATAGSWTDVNQPAAAIWRQRKSRHREKKRGGKGERESERELFTTVMELMSTTEYRR